MSAEQPTAADYIDAIRKALAAHDVKAVDSLLRLMAVRFPQDAQDVLDILKVGITFSREGLL